MIDCAIALGGNQGNVADCFEKAIDRLRDDDRIRVSAISSLYKTAAIGNVAGEPFLNAALSVETSYTAVQLLECLQLIEGDLGRKRSMHWGPRSIDLDLLFYGDAVIRTPTLVVPHPACWYRRFVLDPLSEIAAKVVHPVKEMTVGELQRRLLARPMTVGIAGSREIGPIQNQLSDVLSEVTIRSWQPGDEEPTLLFWLGDESTGGLSFEQLPIVPRIDVSRLGTPEPFMVDVVRSALG